MCVMLALWDAFATVILSIVRHSRGEVYKVMNIKDVLLECWNKRLHKGWTMIGHINKSPVRSSVL